MKSSSFKVLQAHISGDEKKNLGYLPVIHGNNGKCEKMRCLYIILITLMEKNNPIQKKRGGSLKW